MFPVQADRKENPASIYKELNPNGSYLFWSIEAFLLKPDYFSDEEEHAKGRREKHYGPFYGKTKQNLQRCRFPSCKERWIREG